MTETTEKNTTLTDVIKGPLIKKTQKAIKYTISGIRN